MIFELGKYYRHNSGSLLHVIAEAETVMYGDSLIAENSENGNLIPVGRSESNAANWVEIEQTEWNQNWNIKNATAEIKEEEVFEPILNRFEILDL